MHSNELMRLLRKLNACSDAVEWAKGKSFAEAWAQCERADWMMWLCAKMEGTEGWPDRKAIVSLACRCAEDALAIFEAKYPDYNLPKKATEIVRAGELGKVTIKEAHRAACDARETFVSDAVAYFAVRSVTYAVVATVATTAFDAFRAVNATIVAAIEAAMGDAAASVACDGGADDADTSSARISNAATNAGRSAMKKFADWVREDLKVPMEVAA